tara:strand:- start:213 stop:410 length:198 start_codon:yes stop_codon:yes gene_type:complete
MPEMFPKLSSNYNNTLMENCQEIIDFGWKESLRVFFINIPVMIPFIIFTYIFFEKAGIDSRNAFR